MKIRITSRSGDDTHDALEVSDDTESLLRWLSTQGQVTVTPPGVAVLDASWGSRDPVDDRWTVHRIDEYD